MKNALIFLPGGLGDILFMQKLSHLFIEDGYKVTWPVFHEFSWLKNYIPNINWVILDTKDNPWQVGTPLSDEVNFVGKEYYSNQTNIFETDDFLYYNGHGNLEYGPEMQRKYNAVSVDWRDWREYVFFSRNNSKENELFYDILGLKDDDDYVYVNRHWQTRPTKEIYNAISSDPEHYGCKVVQHNIIEGFSVFDWCKVLEKANGINMIATSMCFILESPTLYNTVKDKSLHLWTRDQDQSVVKPIFNLPWNYH